MYAICTCSFIIVNHITRSKWKVTSKGQIKKLLTEPRLEYCSSYALNILEMILFL